MWFVISNTFRNDGETNEAHDKDCEEEVFQLTRAKLDRGNGGHWKYKGEML